MVADPIFYEHTSDMKIITLNTWGGRAGEENLLSFFDKYKENTDVFCLQEIWSSFPKELLLGRIAGGFPLKLDTVMQEGFLKLKEKLSEHVDYFRPHLLDHYGLLSLIKKDIRVDEEGEVFVHKYKGYLPDEYEPGSDLGRHARNIQYIKTVLNDKPLTIINFHGLWNGQGKGDSEDRLNQSKNVLDFIKTLDGEVVLCGDFNLLPDTESLKMFEDYGLKNLIKEYGITSTRTSYYTKPLRFADYVFVSQGLDVKDFKVLPEEVSDHSALYLEI